ncbi:MAG: ABC transporter substrate-binding protein [Reyranellaceae bacterium]
MLRKSIALGVAAVLAGMAAAGAAVAADRTVVIMRTNDTSNYDPQRNGARAGAEIIAMLSDSLLSLAPDLTTIEPGLAQSWSVSPDGLAYTFVLRRDVKFCDGRPMTADDVVYSLRRWIDPATKSPTASRAGDVKEIVAVDPHTVRYVLNKPYNELPYQLTLAYSSIVDRAAVERLGQDFGVTGFNGVGPFCWESWKVRNELVLSRNEHYRWGPPQYENRGPAKVDRVVWRVVPEDNTRIAALETGQGDITYVMPFWAAQKLRASPRVAVAKAPKFGWTAFIGIKMDREQMADPKVRRAMLLAIDQKAMAETIWAGEADPAYTYIAPGILDHDPALEARAAKFDKSAAERLLDEANWRKGPDGFRSRDGQRLAPVMYGQNNTMWRSVLEAVQGQLRAVGIDMQLQLFEPAAAMAKLRTQEFDFFALYSAYLTAGDALDLYFRSTNTPAPNRMNWKDAETDALLDKAQAALTAADRQAAYSKLQQRLYDATVWIPLAHEPMLVFYNKQRVSGVKPHGIGGTGLYKGLDLTVTAR